MNSHDEDTRLFRFRSEQEEDPYEKGFADKLYDDYDMPLEEIPEIDERPAVHERGAQQYYRPGKRQKRLRPLRLLVRLLLIFLFVFASALLTLHFLAEPPRGESPVAHLDDSSTILLAGTDESGDRTDTIMLLNVNRATGRLSLMSIPRDTKVNSTYVPHSINLAYGVNGKGDEGMDSLMDYVSQCVGFRPDGYLLVELDVFVELVDLFGGVKFDVPMDMYYDDPTQDLHIALPAGVQTLDGEEAMGLVRYRYGYLDADLGRISVQRDFMAAAMDQWVSLKNVFQAPGALRLLRSHTVTDMSAANLVWLAEAVLACGTDDMFMTTIPFAISGDYVTVDASGDYLDMLNTYFNPYENAVIWEDLMIAY